MSDRHAQVNEWFDQISASWPHSDRLDLPDLPDVRAQLSNLDSSQPATRIGRVTASWPRGGDIPLPQFPDDPLEGVTFPDQIPDVDPVELTDHARRVLAAIGEHQHGKARGQRKSGGQSAVSRHPAGPAIDVRSLDRKPRCA